MLEGSDIQFLLLFWRFPHCIQPAAIPALRGLFRNPGQCVLCWFRWMRWCAVKFSLCVWYSGCVVTCCDLYLICDVCSWRCVFCHASVCVGFGCAPSCNSEYSVLYYIVEAYSSMVLTGCPAVFLFCFGLPRAVSKCSELLLKCVHYFYYYKGQYFA